MNFLATSRIKRRIGTVLLGASCVGILESPLRADEIASLETSLLLQPGEVRPDLPPTVVQPEPTVEPEADIEAPFPEAEARFDPTVDFRTDSSSTGLNFPAPLIETPATVNVLTDAFLDAQNIRDLQDTLSYVPGASSGGRDLPTFNIRGFGGLALGNPGDNVVFVDNYRFAGSRYHFDPSLYEQVEILKGPSSLLYGASSPGGTVRYISKRPRFTTMRSFEGNGGSFDFGRATVDWTGSVNGSETLAYRLNVSAYEANLTQHGRNDDIGRDDRFIFNPSFLWVTPTGGTVFVGYEYSEQDAPVDYGVKTDINGNILYNGNPFFGPDSNVNRQHNNLTLGGISSARTSRTFSTKTTSIAQIRKA